MQIHEHISVSVSPKAVFDSAYKEELYSLLDPIMKAYLEEADANLRAHSEYLEKYKDSGDTEPIEYQRACKIASEFWVAHLKDAINSLHRAVEEGHIMYSRARGCKGLLTIGSFIDFNVKEQERLDDIKQGRR